MVDWSDINAVFRIAVILILSSFALFLPLHIWIGKNLATKFAIPVSISFQIIFGYILYCFGLTKYYPAIYALVILGLNIWALFRLKQSGLSDKFYRPKDIAICIVPLVLFCIIIYNRFFDSFSTVAPGEIDTYNHLVFLRDLIKDGVLSFPQYAPGFHLFIFPLTFFAKTSEIYRFAGPVIGSITAIGTFLLFRETFVSRYSRYILLLVSLLPIFNQLFLQEIGFFSSSLSFIFLPILIYIIANKKEKESVATKSYMIILALITISLSLTLPYLYLQYLPALFVLFLITILFRKYVYTGYIRHLVIILVISILGFFVAFGHVFLQTKILKRATSFPAMELTYLENGEIIKTDNYKINNTSDNKANASSSTNKNSNLTKLISKIKNNEIFSGYINPMFNVAWNAMMIKNIRMPDNILSLGAYLWILLSIILIPISIIKKNWVLLTIMAFSLVFGLSTQLGILEVSTYRGRSGWYLMFLTSIGAIFIADYIIAKKLDSKKIILPLIAILGVMGIIKPPVYYRPYYTEPYSIIKKAINDSPQASFNIITRDKHIGVLSDNLSIKTLSADSVREPCGKDICLIVIEKELMVVDPVLSQQALAIDKNFQTFNQLQNEARTKNQIQIQEIKAMPQFSSYKLYWSNEKIDIYEYRKL